MLLTNLTFHSLGPYDVSSILRILANNKELLFYRCKGMSHSHCICLLAGIHVNSVNTHKYKIINTTRAMKYKFSGESSKQGHVIDSQASLEAELYEKGSAEWAGVE